MPTLQLLLPDQTPLRLMLNLGRGPAERLANSKRFAVEAEAALAISRIIGRTSGQAAPSSLEQGNPHCRIS
jgi:hypothetical protein